jgi:F-type H+-transporting ATPase subunit a
MSASIHISLSAEPIFYIGSFPVTNSMFTSLIVSALIIAFALAANRSFKKTDRPSGLQNLAEFIVESFYHFTHSITGNMGKAQAFMPWVATFFIVIMINNWSGLIPGVGYIFVPEAEPPVETSAQRSLLPQVQATTTEAETITERETNPTSEAVSEHASSVEGKSVPLFRAGTADLNLTLALGLISVFMIQFFGFRYQGLSYISKYLNFSSPINFFIGILELISEFGKIISFGFRLFGNIFAGEVLIGVLMYLTKVLVPVPFYGLEIFVGMIQAVVFSMLSLVLFNMATIGHHEEH